MNRPRIIALFALAICAAGLLWLLWPHQREPRYEGRSLSEWLEAYRQGESQQSPEAVRHIGTNALPSLVTWVQEAQDIPPWRQRLFSLANHWNFGDPLLELIARPQFRPARAIRGFEILGETARGAVPDLARVASEGKRPSSEAAFEALTCLGKDALPPILSMITNTAFPFGLRHRAVSSLGQMGYLGTNAHPAVVLLIRCLDEPSLAFVAADTLGRLHLESDITVPALVEGTRFTDRDMRIRAVSGLEEFGPAARAAVPELTRLLSDPDAAVRYTTTNALENIAPEVLHQSSAP